MTDTTPLLVQRRITTPADTQSLLPAPVRAPTKQKTVLIDNNGFLSYTQLKKHSLVQDLQLRHRDIRALEPGVSLPYPAAVFVRKAALILNLEGLKLIITKDKTLIISVPHLDDLSARTLPDLQSPVCQRLGRHIAVAHTDAEGGGGLEELQYLRDQPYELRALEAALHIMASILNTEVTKVEGLTMPILARIRRNVQRADLEMLYDTQNKLNKIVSRVGKIKEVLEELLDDPDEMEGMCLTRTETLAAQAALAAAAAAAARSPSAPSSPAAFSSSLSRRLSSQQQQQQRLRTVGSSGSLNGATTTTTTPPLPVLSPIQTQHVGPDIDEEEIGVGDGFTPAAASLQTPVFHSTTTPLHPTMSTALDNLVDEDDEELGELEDMIEARWLQVDSILSRLTILQERIINTEHLVNLDLDAKRNSLVALGLMTDLLLLVFEAHMTVTSIFGMNLTSGLEPLQPYSLWGIASIGMIFGTILATSIYRIAKNRGLLLLPSFRIES